MCELNHTKRKLEFIVIFVRGLKASRGSSRQFDSVVPSRRMRFVSGFDAHVVSSLVGISMGN